MSDLVRKTVTISDVQETSGYKERRFKKTVNLKLKIGSTGGHNNNGPVTPSIKPNDSFPALEELLQCGICLERLSNPRMLPCQHTFCLNCLKTHVTAKNLRIVNNQNTNDSLRGQKFTIEQEIKSMACPVCQSRIQLSDGIDSLDKLPKNLYLQSLLKMVQGSPVSPHVTENYRCVNCQMVSAQQEQVCQHCMQIFCNICWNVHLAELESNLSLIVKQLDESEDRMRHKLDNFAGRCDTLEAKIKMATKTRIENILEEEKRVLGEVTSIKKEGSVASDILLDSISKLKEDINVKARNRNNNQKVTSYINLHRETSKILEQVNYFGEARLTFDPDTFKLEQISEGIYNDEEDQQVSSQVVTNPLESCDSMAKHYKSRSFNPKLVWNKCPRPAGLGIAPWDESKLYIAATDSHNVLIVDRNKFKLIDRLSYPDMICPSGITFSLSRKEVFVSDKWKQCIHVFSSDGEYLRAICGQRLRSPDGIVMHPNEQLIVCDTGNDRILLIDPQSGDKLATIGTHNGLTQLNFPTSVALYGSNIIVADSGNNRIKIYNVHGELLQEIGSFGKNPGQFRSAEVVAVDQLGFILVGDAGNARIQVFQPDGRLVKIFGSKSGFGWVSGILVTPELDIITSDSKIKRIVWDHQEMALRVIYNQQSTKVDIITSSTTVFSSRRYEHLPYR